MSLQELAGNNIIPTPPPRGSLNEHCKTPTTPRTLYEYIAGHHDFLFQLAYKVVNLVKITLVVAGSELTFHEIVQVVVIENLDVVRS